MLLVHVLHLVHLDGSAESLVCRLRYLNTFEVPHHAEIRPFHAVLDSQLSLYPALVDKVFKRLDWGKFCPGTRFVEQRTHGQTQINDF